MKKQELCHIYACFLGWLCVLVNLFDVFHGCQQQFMVFVSENGKTGTFSHLWMSTAIHVCFMVFSLRMKKQEFSHLKKQEFSHIYGCFLGWLCVLFDLFDVFLGCQHQIMDVLWFLSVRI